MKRTLLRYLSVLLMLTISTIANAQEKTITGTIVSKEDGLPLPGVSIKLKKSTIGTTSNAAGKFTLRIPANEEHVLVISFIGYLTQEIKTERKISFDVALVANDNTLNEVVVSAGGILRKPKEQGYAATRVTAEELTKGKSPTIAGGLIAKVPGLQINAITSGVNPNYRLVLRGNRSLTGDNTALIVVDNVVVPSSILGNINPEDVENISVLNGAAGATLYGSEASNGVLLITTKKGKEGKPVVRLSNTTTLEQISFFPKLQDRFGAGSTADAQIYNPIENQQFGPAFDGSSRPLGDPLANGDQQYVIYSPVSDRNDFWQTGVTTQTDFSVSSGDDKSTTYVAGQYLDGSGTTPGDKFKRISLRFNGTRKIIPNLSIDYAANYIENNYDVTSATATVYSSLIQVPANIPLSEYEDWQNGKYSNLDGFYNPWYLNPYWEAANRRQNSKNAYLTGKVELKYSPLAWLNFTYRAGLSNRYYTNKSRSAVGIYTDYSQSLGKTNFAGTVSDAAEQTSRFSNDFLVNMKQEVKDFSVNLILGASSVNKTSKDVGVGANGLVIPDLYNVSNRTGIATATESNTKSKLYGLWADATIGYKNYLYLHLTGRNDWTSLLSKENRSFFYPSADLSFIVSDAFPKLKETRIIDDLKVRAAVSKTGLVNIDPYSLDPIFDSVTGFSSGTFFTQNGTLASTDLKPETTRGYELGTDFRLFNGKIDAGFTYYYTSTKGQAIYAGIPLSTGFSSYLINTGEVTNQGIETALHVTPLETGDWKLTVGGNYTFNENVLKSLHPTLKTISINTSNVIYAVEGQPINSIIVTDYKRDDQGRVIVDPYTGYPSQAATTQNLGSTTPKYRLGLDLLVSYKDFTLTSLFEYRGGYKVASISLGNNLDFAGASARSAYYNRERFVFPNSSYLDASTGNYVENTSITVSDGGSGFWTSGAPNRSIYSNYVYSGNYWKWREVSLAYNLPGKILGKQNAIKALQVSVQGRNLLLWTPASNEYTDPDYSANDNNAVGVSTLAQTPPTRYFGATLSVTF
ncbi:SusC/RagA family TonB-linked outer membrane protein [Pedobacter sp. AW31-3R]|uniref:SusC/RagA family TonB-linked outer membrane protein n=1 Tax=Pedobacter sp. AW31-3R TaxID=3445781 RepID=UPI003FA05759